MLSLNLGLSFESNFLSPDISKYCLIYLIAQDLSRDVKVLSEPTFIIPFPLKLALGPKGANPKKAILRGSLLFQDFMSIYYSDNIDYIKQIV